MVEIPKQDKLLKLLRMTTSPNDGEALTAIRIATKLLDEAGWTWDKLIAGKITVVADPFANLGMPPAPAPVQRSAPPPPPTPRAKPIVTTWPIGIDVNRFPGHCWACGVEVIAGAGKWFNPSRHHPRAVNASKVICSTCDTTATILPYAVVPVRKGRQKSVSDLA